jgi:hypothetical protein
MGDAGVAGALPEGTVTFLFTDLEGSTRLLEAHPHAYRAARRHHALLRGAVEGHGGVVFETVGDAVYAAFARPTDAVRAAGLTQEALAERAGVGARTLQGLEAGTSAPLRGTARRLADGRGLPEAVRAPFLAAAAPPPRAPGPRPHPRGTPPGPAGPDRRAGAAGVEPAGEPAGASG